MNGTSNGFQIGEKIGFLYEKGNGVILEQKGKGIFLVEDELGFQRICRANEIMKLHGSEYQLPDDEALRINEDDTFSKSKHVVKQEFSARNNKSSDVWEIDLHIEVLLDSHAGMSNSEILNLQMKEFKSFLNKAKSKRIRKIIIIHGVGAGVLKEEVRLFLSKMDGIELYDADYQEYGKGATAVEIRYNIL